MRRSLYPALCVFLAAASAVLADRWSDRPAVARFGFLDLARFKLYASPKDLPIANAITEAEKMYKAEQFAKAQAAFKAIQAIPGAAAIKGWAACMEAMSLANQEKYEDARAILKKVVEAAPKSADAHLADYGIGATYKLAYDDDKTVAHFDAYLDNPDRKADTNYYDRALEWQTEQYRGRSTTNPNDAKLKARFYQLLDTWVAAHPDRTMDYNLLYKFYRLQDKWSDCLRVAAYRMKPAEAAVSVLGDQLVRTQEICDASKLGAAEAAKAAKPRIAAYQAEAAKLKDLNPDTQRAMAFQLVQTLLVCGMPEEGDRAALDWMAAHPTDRTALYMYIGYLRAAKSARPEVLDRIVGDFLKQKPADDVRVEVLDLYADVAVPTCKDRATVEAILKQYDAPPSAMAALYTGWKNEQAEESWKKVLADTNALDETRFKAMMIIGDLDYGKGAVARATNLYQMALDFTAVNRKFAADMERLRDRIAQEQYKAGVTNEALALFQQNLNSRQTEYWTRANLFHARENMKSKDIRALMAGDQMLRRVLGQTNRGGPWQLAIQYSEAPAIRKMQDEAKALCEKHELDLTQQPMDHAAWGARLRAKSKEEFDKRLKSM